MTRSRHQLTLYTAQLFSSPMHHFMCGVDIIIHFFNSKRISFHDSPCSACISSTFLFLSF